MKKNKICLCAILVGLSILAAPVTFAEEEVVIPAETVTSENTAVIQSFIYEWRYKKENGHIYKRLYNCTTGYWVGDWILVY